MSTEFLIVQGLTRIILDKKLLCYMVVFDSVHYLSYFILKQSQTSNNKITSSFWTYGDGSVVNMFAV